MYTSAPTPAFRRVLAGVDGSSHALGAVALALLLGGPAVSLTVVHAISRRQRVEQADAGLEAARLTCSPALARVRPLLEGRDDVAYAAPRGRDPATELHRIARETGADLIVVGASRRLGAGRVVLGSHAEAVLHGAPCAVAVAPPVGPSTLQRIGVAFDGTPAGQSVVGAAASVARAFGAELTVLAVIDTRHAYATFGFEGGYGDLRERALALTQEAVRGIGDLPAVRPQLHRGDPVHEIVALGRVTDLLVVGARDNGPVLRLLLGSTSAHVVRRATCPVLVVPVAGGVRDADR